VDKNMTNHRKMLAQLRADCDLMIHYTLVEWFLINIEPNERIVVAPSNGGKHIVCVTLEIKEKP
jgi:hypothetical protein